MESLQANPNRNSREAKAVTIVNIPSRTKDCQGLCSVRYRSKINPPSTREKASRAPILIVFTSALIGIRKARSAVIAPVSI